MIMTVMPHPQLAPITHPRIAARRRPPSGTRSMVSNVSKSYGVGEFAKTVVRDCTFTIEPGKLTVMIGPSGCGKSTFIRLLAGFERPSSGHDHASTASRSPGPGLDRMVLFQETALFPVDDDIRQHHVRSARARRGAAAKR